MLKLIEGNFDNPEVNELLKKHFVELSKVSPKGSTHVLDIPGLKVSSIKFRSRDMKGSLHTSVSNKLL